MVPVSSNVSGNHGDGTIDAFDPITGLLLGMLSSGKPDRQREPVGLGVPRPQVLVLIRTDYFHFRPDRS